MIDAAPSEPIVRHLRKIVMWPLQLIALSPKSPVQHHWQGVQLSAVIGRGR